MKTVCVKYVSLFSGIGGFEVGIQNACPEAKCVFASEIDEHARRIYQKQFGVMPYGDITQINAGDVPDHDILVGGFPCQSFSIAGRKQGIEDARGTLFFEIARIAREKQPRILLLENVPGLLSNSKGSTFLAFLSIMDEIGYDVEWQVLNTKTIGGLPQSRERLFIIGHLRKSGQCWNPILPYFIKDSNYDQLQSDKEEERTWIPCLTTRYGERYVGEGYIRQRVPKSCRVHNLQTRVPTRPSLKYSQCGSGLLSKTDGTTYCVDTQNKQAVELDYEEYYTIRKMTPQECEQLQGFPVNWTQTGVEYDPKINKKLRSRYLTTKKRMRTNGRITEEELQNAIEWVNNLPENEVPISDSQRYKCIGNAVTTTVIEQIFKRCVIKMDYKFPKVKRFIVKTKTMN